MKYTNEDYCALAAAAAELVPAVAQAGILIDTDSMSGACFQHAAGKYQIEASREETVPGSFFAEAAAQCGLSPEALLQTCGDLRNPFQRYLRREKATDEPLPGLPISCEQLDRLYESSYGPALLKLTEALRTQCGEDTPVILVGQTAALYPAEHTVRQLLSFMPFIPVVKGLVTAPTLTVPAAELIEKGKHLLAEQEQAKKRIQHTIMLQFKRLDGDKLTDHLHTLAEKGSDLEALLQPVYSEAVFVSAEDSLVLFADSTPYPLRLPRSVFPLHTEGRPRPDLAQSTLTLPNTVTAARFALGLKNGIPILLVRTNNGISQVTLDKNIYTEG